MRAPFRAAGAHSVQLPLSVATNDENAPRPPNAPTSLKGDRRDTRRPLRRHDATETGQTAFRLRLSSPWNLSERGIFPCRAMTQSRCASGDRRPATPSSSPFCSTELRGTFAGRPQARCVDQQLPAFLSARSSTAPAAARPRNAELTIRDAYSEAHYAFARPMFAQLLKGGRLFPREGRSLISVLTSGRVVLFPADALKSEALND
jgi:hypothetical protein